MKESFAAGTRRLSALAARALGWRPEDFWNATPAELAACLTDPDTEGADGMDRAALEALMERESNG